MNSNTKYLLVKFKGPRAKKYRRKFLKKLSKQKMLLNYMQTNMYILTDFLVITITNQ